MSSSSQDPTNDDVAVDPNGGVGVGVGIGIESGRVSPYRMMTDDPDDPATNDVVVDPEGIGMASGRVSPYHMMTDDADAPGDDQADNDSLLNDRPHPISSDERQTFVNSGNSRNSLIVSHEDGLAGFSTPNAAGAAGAKSTTVTDPNPGSPSDDGSGKGFGGWNGNSPASNMELMMYHRCVSDVGACFSTDAFDEELFQSSPKDVRRSELGKIIRTQTTTTSSLDHKTLITALYLSVFAIAGSLFRVVLAQLFGEECKNPGTVGWLAAGQPFCVTAAGVEREGGVVFADLPSNMLGSFFMGMMQTGSVLGLTSYVPIAFASVASAFQNWDIIHLAIRTGFCGSLTTFSSWNSEMVVLIYGTGDDSEKSKVFQALFGYVIGLETAMGSYVFGKKIAVWLHRRFNPTLQREADAVARRGGHVHLNRKLPGFERRFLAGVIDKEELMHHDARTVQWLDKWRSSTVEERRVGSDHALLTALDEVEHLIIVREQYPNAALLATASNAGWDVESLWKWTRSRNFEFERPRLGDTPLFTVPSAIVVLLCVTVPLIIALVVQSDDDEISKTYRTMWYAALLAPSGALLRWKLSSMNGTLGGQLTWLPFGTLCANFLGATISIIMISFEVRMDGHENFWVMGTIRAIKVGFAGCLTTVSSFVSELDTLSKGFPRNNWDWHYILLTLGGSCVIGVAVYGFATFTIIPDDQQGY